MTSTQARSAEVIDLEDYRKARSPASAAPPRDASFPFVPVLLPMAWIPIWFVPVHAPGTYTPAG